MKNNFIYFISFFFITFYQVNGQKPLEREILLNGNVNDDGSAVTYFLTKEASSSLNLYHVHKKRVMQFYNIHIENVLTDKVWIGWDSKDKIIYKVDLENWTRELIHDVDSYQWLSKFNSILLFDKKKKKVQILNEKSENIFEIENVHFYKFLPEDNSIVIVKHNGVLEIIRLNGKRIQKKRIDLKFPSTNLKKIIWNPYDKKIYLFQVDNSMMSIYCYTEHSLKKVGYTGLKDTEFSQIDTTFVNLEFLDKYKVLYGVKADSKPQKEVYQIWLGNSRGLTPILHKLYTDNLQAAVIDLESEKKISFFEVGKINVFKIHPVSRAIYSFEKNEFEDFTKQYPSIKVYEHDLKHNKKILIGEFSGRSSYFVNSALNQDVFYFKNNEWYSYDGKTKKHTHVTKGINHKFYDYRNELFDGKDFIPNQRIPTYKNKWLIFESESDIWLYDPIMKSFKKQTNGKSIKKKYSLVPSEFKTDFNKLYWSPLTKIVNDIILLQWQSDDLEHAGLSLLENGEVKDLIQVKGQISQAKQSKGFITYVKERADSPQALYILNKNLKNHEVIYQTNKNETLIPKTKYVTWVNEKGQQRGVLVRFPKNYDANRKYPAVVYVYEKKSMNIHSYDHIERWAGAGINYRQYTEDGYFVIEPDIYYELGATGKSAYDCVNIAVDKVLLQCSIDPSLIGIIGHSFGGYQTNFILTQTGRFRAAISSSSIFDLESYYLTINWETMKPNMWRMENQQFRMGKGMYEDREVYRSNSPAVYAENISTPVLIVSGGKDTQVDWQQSVMMFLSLKRLNKEVNLLLYPTEGHTMLEAKARKDYNIKLKEWFNYYLKNESKPEWLNEGLQ